jgi:hypothetical protein
MHDRDLSDSDAGELAARNICERCIAESFLKQQAQSSRLTAACDYCDNTGPVLSIAKVADHVEGAIKHHYVCTSVDVEHVYYDDRGQPVQDLIGDLVGISDDAAGDVRQYLYYVRDDIYDEQNPFDEEATYAETPPSDEWWQQEWERLEQSLLTSARYFNETVNETLKGLFAGLDSLVTASGEPVVVEAGPGQALHRVSRARVFQNHSEMMDALKRPDLDVGAPPSSAARAGRMNASGIPVFYGATTDDVAIAEVRPPVGSYVVVAQFEVTRPLRILDLEALPRVVAKGSRLDNEYGEARKRAAFFSTLSHRLTRPVMPNDESTDYLVTQAVAEFLANRITPLLDGIMFRSSQAKKLGKNVVLFQKAARVELPVVYQSKVTVVAPYLDEDGTALFPNYMVTETIPRNPEGAERRRLRLQSRSHQPEDGRLPALRLVADAVAVHHIRGVAYEWERYGVDREREVAPDPGPARSPTS